MMTRVLPWLKKPGADTPKSRPPGRNVAPPRAKRRRVVEPSSDIDVEYGEGRTGGNVTDLQSSPPRVLEPPLQSPMDEGLDKDDKFRMVEDEFLDVAKQFTQHLHAAEYQRLKRVARSQNAAIINSISQPVTIKMPDETRRKVESVARAKKQAAAVRAVVRTGNQDSESNDDSDGDTGAWVGTALHGLMESPRKSTASLAKVGKVTISTRAASGFRKPSQKESLHSSQSPLSDLESFKVTGSRGNLRMKESPGSSSEDDEDLDAPIRSRVHHMHNASTWPKKAAASEIAQTAFGEAVPRGTQPSVVVNNATVADDNDERTAPSGAAKARERIAKRLQQARLRRLKDEQGNPEKLDSIPMFLS